MIFNDEECITIYRNIKIHPIGNKVCIYTDKEIFGSTEFQFENVCEAQKWIDDELYCKLGDSLEVFCEIEADGAPISVIEISRKDISSNVANNGKLNYEIINNRDFLPTKKGIYLICFTVLNEKDLRLTIFSVSKCK